MKSRIAQIGQPFGDKGTKSLTRTVLITIQLSISLILIVTTLVVSKQFNFLKSFQLGFDSEQIIVIPIKDRSQNDRYTVMVNEIKQLAGIKNASYSSSTPGSSNSLTYTYSFVGSDLESRAISTFLIDENFLDLYGIKLKMGRSINPTKIDTLSEILLNEAAVQQLQLTDPIGQQVRGKIKGRVVGIIENFNYTSLHSAVEPVILYSYTPTFRFVSAKLQKNSAEEGLASLEKQWPKLYPGYPFEYTFLDEKNNNLYRAESQLTQTYKIFSLIAIIIAGIGLIGLTVYLMDRLLREISIRKVLGSTSYQLIQLIYLRYTKIILVAVLISWTIAYFWMNVWLNGFAYKIKLSPIYFIVPSIVVIIVLLLTTGVHILKASRSNPVENLKDE